MDPEIGSTGVAGSGERPLLTIAVPTYNRCALLEATLETIASQVAPVRHEVELLVANNGSPDATAAMLESFVVRYPFVKVHNHPANIGPDPNFAFCLRQATGRYFWLYGDDDLLGDGAIEALASVLRAEDPDIVHLRHEWFVGEPPPIPKASGKYTVYRDERAFLKAIGPLVTFITSTVVRNSGVSDNVLDALTGSFMIQYAWVLPRIAPGTKMVYLDGLNLLARGSNSYGYSYVDTFGKSMQKTLARCEELGILSAEDRKHLLLVFLGDYLPYALLADRSGLDKSFSRADFVEAYRGFPFLGGLSYLTVRFRGAFFAKVPLGIHRRILHKVI